MNRKLIRPNLAEIKELMAKTPASGGNGTVAAEAAATRRSPRMPFARKGQRAMQRAAEPYRIASPRDQVAACP